ncbi:YqzL family protein [Laceyella putida]|uniref:YqzL family protein n=1 Tax=Laceyella putida TaxID=110101 RepID=A0ABW2RHX6_9BACL
MRTLVWNVFQHTGSIDAYLLYKDLEGTSSETMGSPEEDDEEHG